MRLFSWSSSKNIQTIAKIVAQGRVIAGSSDTVLGLVTVATAQGRAAFDRVKHRTGKPYVVLVSEDIVRAKLAPTQCFLFEKIFKDLWPGPLTIIAPIPGFDAEAYSISGEVALRIPEHDGLQALIALVGPLFSTSANITGGLVPRTLSHISDPLRQHIDGLVHDPVSEPKELASTIIRIHDGGYTIVRPGAMPVAQIDAVLADISIV